MVKLFSYEPTHTNGSVEAVEHGQDPTTTQTYNSTNNVDVPTEEMDLGDYDDNDIVKETSNDNNTTEELEDTLSEDLYVESFEGLSPEQLIYLEGQLTKEEYDELKANIYKYYDEYVKYLNNVLEGENGDAGLNQQLRDINSLIDTFIIEAELEASAQVYDTSEDLYANYRKSENIHKEELEAFGVSTYEELLNLRDETKETMKQIKQMKVTAEQLRDSSEFDNLNLREDYANYKPREFTQEDIDELNNYVNRKSTHIQDEMGEYSLEYNYDAYVRDHPDMNITPAEFIQLIEQSNPAKDYSVKGIKNAEDLKAMIAIMESSPDLVQKYNFLYKEDPEEAKKYLKAVEYQINNIKGQLAAKEFLDTLAAAGDDEDALDEAIYNEFEVHIKGVKDGLGSFIEGLYYSAESIFTGENRVMSETDYEKMYILQALMSKNEKQKLGLINADGTATDPNAIIDFSKEYTGPLLKNNYEISQGIGNMLPSIMLSMINPALGSVSLGVSAYGNAYHEAMISGVDKMNAILYGMVTGCSEAITERILGGLPGLSDTVVSGFKGLAKAMGKEGTQEMFQGILDLGFRHALLGEELPSNWEELKAAALDIVKQGAYGALTAGYMQLPSAIIGSISIKAFNNYMKKVSMTSEDLSKAIEILKMRNPELAKLTEEDFKARYGGMLINIHTENKIMNMTNSVKKGELSLKELNDYIDAAINENLIDNRIVNLVFKELFGSKLSSWMTSQESTKTILYELSLACEKGNISFEKLAKCIDVMEAMEDYYARAKNIDLETDADMLETYRTHGIVHIFDVLTQSINAYSALNDAGLTENGINMDLDTIMLAAVMHDTGMSGGQQIHLSVDDNKKLIIKLDNVQSSGNNVRESHSYNSGVDILVEAENLIEAGYSKEQIAEAALLAFAHSKSNSGLNPLLNNPAGWSFAIQALQEANIKNSQEKGTEPFDFLGALVSAGIISDINPTSTDSVTVKCPKVYVETSDGHIMLLDTKKVVLEEDGKYYQVNKDGSKVEITNVDEHIVYTDENGNYYKLDANGNKIPYSGKVNTVQVENAGGQKTGNIDVYSFENGIIEKLSYEALVVRIGDALTNNDNGIVNQYYEELSFDNTNWDNTYNTSQIIESMDSKFQEAVDNGNIKNKPTAKTIIRALLTMKDGLQDAAFAESLHENANDSVTYQRNGKEENRAQPFVLGEYNQTYEVRKNPSGNSIDVIVSVKDSSHVPYATIFAIEERAGELKSIAKEADIYKTDGNVGINLVIEIDESTPEDIKSLYEQYEAVYKGDSRINVEIKYKK